MSTLKKIVVGAFLGVFMFVGVSALGTVGLEAQNIPGRDVLCGPEGCPVTGDETFENADENTIARFIINIASFITFIVGALAVLFLVYGGFLFVVNPGGGDENAQRGRKIVQNAIIGLVIAIVAYSVVNLIGNLVQGEFVSN